EVTVSLLGARGKPDTTEIAGFAAASQQIAGKPSAYGLRPESTAGIDAAGSGVRIKSASAFVHPCAASPVQALRRKVKRLSGLMLGM
ncbi:hypothetical protein, partial [Pseudomonas sp.]|uniref:hypothetical protein n=1 Tax=Pseudomonas sp. TaxID=306 RepID=UPI0028AACB53